jgi:hypothetical protein
MQQNRSSSSSSSSSCPGCSTSLILPAQSLVFQPDTLDGSIINSNSTPHIHQKRPTSCCSDFALLQHLPLLTSCKQRCSFCQVRPGHLVMIFQLHREEPRMFIRAPR